jgi:exoribonuclease R
MKAIRDPNSILARGLARLRAEFELPTGFPPEVLKDAQAAAKRRPGPQSHRDRTDLPFVTLDPASSTDLDQAFHIERLGADILLFYAIADVPWFVEHGSALADEAWRRGMTVYLPDGKARLYPEAIAEGAASLLPDGPRPAVVFVVRVSPEGASRIDAVERATIRSRAKLAYETATEADMPAAERERGAARVDPPEQELQAVGDGRFALSFRPRRQVEQQNAALSMAANLAVAQLFIEHRTGLFRVMKEPDRADVARLRAQAAALRIDWAETEPLQVLERRLDPDRPAEAAFMLAIRRAGNGASYAPYRAGETPWHAAIASSYAHATAPLRRLADRYVVEAALALANGRGVPGEVKDAFRKLPRIMARAGSLAGRVEASVLDLAEAVMLRGREGETFDAAVIATGNGRITVQLAALPVLAKLGGSDGMQGERLRLRLDDVDTENGRLRFSRA